MYLIDWQGDPADALALFDFLRLTGINASPYRRTHYEPSPSLAVLFDPKGRYSLAPPYPKIAILEGKDPDALSVLTHTGIPVIPVGFSSLDSISYSSMTGEHCSVSIERPILTLQGKVIPEQELVLSCPCGGIPLLLRLTAALVLGAPPLGTALFLR